MSRCSQVALSVQTNLTTSVANVILFECVAAGSDRYTHIVNDHT